MITWTPCASENHTAVVVVDANGRRIVALSLVKGYRELLAGLYVLWLVSPLPLDLIVMRIAGIGE